MGTLCMKKGKTESWLLQREIGGEREAMHSSLKLLQHSLWTQLGMNNDGYKWPEWLLF